MIYTALAGRCETAYDSPEISWGADLIDKPEEVDAGPYPRAPITEAIIDIRFASPLEADVCNRVKTKLQTAYPIANDWEERSVTLDTAKQAAEFQATAKGYRLSTL